MCSKKDRRSKELKLSTIKEEYSSINLKVSVTESGRGMCKEENKANAHVYTELIMQKFHRRRTSLAKQRSLSDLEIFQKYRFT